MEKTRTFSRGYAHNGVNFAIDVVVDTDTELSSVQIMEVPVSKQTAWFKKENDVESGCVSSLIESMKTEARQYANSFKINHLIGELTKNYFVESTSKFDINKIEDTQGGQDE